MVGFLEVKMKKRIVILLLALMMVLAACGEKPLTKEEGVFYGTFDTMIMFVSYTKTKEEFNEQYAFVESEFKRLHNLYDGFNQHEGITNIYELNKNAGKGPMKVEKDLFDLIKFSIDNYEKTNGKMNIALGSVTKIWMDARNRNSELGTDHTHEGEDHDHESEIYIPTMDELNEANKHTNIKDILLDEANMTVELKDPLMRLDVGAIAKGYATELVIDGLKDKGVKHASINAGGNVRTIGTPGDGRPKWGLAIQNPDENNSDYLEVLYIGETSLVTSGDYQRYFEKDGVRYHHIIDPDTLMPKTLYNSVSIITEDSGLADYLSTTLYLVDKKEAEQILSRFDEEINVLWYSKEEGKTNTKGLDEFMESKGAQAK